MGKSRKSGRKVRVEFRQNRNAPGRGDDWTRKYRHDEDRAIDARQHEAIRAKGDLSRKRTIIVDGEQLPIVDESQWHGGVTVAVHGLVCRVCDDQGRIWDCTVRRILRTVLIEQRAPVTVGDRVWFAAVSEPGAAAAAAPKEIAEWRRVLTSPDGGSAPAGGVGVIERVAPRRTTLSRRERRGREHTIVANADQLLIIGSVAQPRLKPHLIDRYIVAAHRGGLRPVIVMNKMDLAIAHGEEEDAEGASADSAAGETDDVQRAIAGDSGGAPESDEADYEDADDAEWYETAVDIDDDFGEGGPPPPRMTLGEVVAEYRALGYRVILASAATGQGVSELRGELRDRITALSGQSGVGKSSLINLLEPGLGLSVGEVSGDNEKGRHTTSHSQLLRLSSGGFVVDTPGVRSFDLWGIEPVDLEAYFVEIAPLVAQCRYSNCSHTSEEGCAVLDAVERGAISPRRLASYLKMFAEASARLGWRQA